MRWLVLLVLVAVVPTARARVFRCTDGFVPASVGRRVRYGDCDRDGIVNDVCSFRGRRPGAVITVQLSGHRHAHRTLGGDAFVCRTSGTKAPVLEQYADPCTETCTFSVCVDDGAAHICEDPCRYDYRLTVAPPGLETARAATLTDLEALGPSAPAISVWCHYSSLPCLCLHDTDCDDGSPQTRDVCLPASPQSSNGHCLHLCPADDPTPPGLISTTSSTTSTSVSTVTLLPCPTTSTTTLPPSCDPSCAACAMDSACVATAEGTAACINNPCQQTGCTTTSACGAHQVCSQGQCCPLCP